MIQSCEELTLDWISRGNRGYINKYRDFEVKKRSRFFCENIIQKNEKIHKDIPTKKSTTCFAIFIGPIQSKN